MGLSLHLNLIYVVSGPKFTGRFSPNAEGIDVDKLVFRFWTSPSILKFKVVRNRPEFCMFFDH